MNDRRTELGWTLVRVVFGLSLAWGHGLPKLAGGHMDQFAAGVAELGFPFPLYFAWAAAVAEFAGGIFVALGFFTRPAAAVAAFTMLVAIYRHRLQGFGERELAMLYCAAMIAFLIGGAGRFSVDGRMKKPKYF